LVNTGLSPHPFDDSERSNSMLKRLLLVTIFASLSLPYVKVSAQTESKELYPIIKNGRQGFIDRTGGIIVERKLDVAYVRRRRGGHRLRR
jgi:hypothetical protein